MKRNTRNFGKPISPKTLYDQAQMKSKFDDEEKRPYIKCQACGYIMDYPPPADAQKGYFYCLVCQERLPSNIQKIVKELDDLQK